MAALPGTSSEYKTKDTKIPMFLCLFMILAGILIAFMGNPQNDFHRYSFAILISLGTGLGATYLTGKITGGGKFGFLNIKSATGGFFVWLIALAAFLYFFPKPSTKNYPIIAGKWTYVCTGHDGKYQHGGRFTATQSSNEWILKGERMWKDTVIGSTNTWDSALYIPTKNWHSVCGYLDENEIRFEYLIENVGGEDIHGYAKGDITLNDKNEIIKIKGIFNQLYPSKQISGDIEFIRVSDNQFNNPVWVKNHKYGEFHSH